LIIVDLKRRAIEGESEKRRCAVPSD
jgi:hypothetical protein